MIDTDAWGYPIYLSEKLEQEHLEQMLKPEDFTVVDWKFETDDPVAEMDVIMEEYRKCTGIYPGPEMGKVVDKTKLMLLYWWGWHREKIREALVKHMENINE